MVARSERPSNKPEDGEVSEANERTCIVTREAGTPETLIRFVADPGGRVVPDIKRELPGRGCWVTARRDLVDKAVSRKAFARALKADVVADAELGLMVDRLLSSQLAGMMNLARKAGQFVTGSAKVELAVRTGEAIAVFHSTEAAADGVRKINQARKAWHLGMETEAEIPSYSLLSGDEMDALLGENAFIHAAALAGQAGEGVVKRANLLERYRGGEPGMRRVAGATRL
ncbi:RNA-binding protein [Ciceribacter sp. L1K23]|uniref:RNA-binding protein n=1 Tax=unclassified Ciceribacter TaxID=2628820 RepID=UPI001ABDED57|nr:MULTISPECIES: RNA-binding protein [unclassified Ciceribacter]MBO3758491.1 RNA-binding protein [Ciceribacter sp. L1K22]MBR0557509.1 RNA-binding protein [Ciceribacter sp. L1K23]